MIRAFHDTVTDVGLNEVTSITSTAAVNQGTYNLYLGKQIYLHGLMNVNTEIVAAIPSPFLV